MTKEIQSVSRLLSTNLQELHTLDEIHLTNSKAANTKKAYGSDWQLFVQWCEANSCEALPASQETLVYYLTYLGKTCKASTIKRKMTAISQCHETGKYDSPTKTPLVQGVWQGIQRTSGVKETGKEARLERAGGWENMIKLKRRLAEEGYILVKP